MAEGLTFEQVKRAGAFAWHELHFFFANDTLLRVVPPVASDSAASDAGRFPMTVRPSSLRGTGHLLDEGWHHLDGCSCPYCSSREDPAKHAADCSRCGGHSR
jgi:hypothetical protein